MTTSRRALGWFGAVGGVLVAGFVAGFVVFVATVRAPPPPAPLNADGIVALTGGPERVETALHLLADGNARLLLVSGVAHAASLPELMRRAAIADGPIAARVTLGRAAETTLGNARETAEWARANDVRSLIVVTAAFHMPRALLELRRMLPGVTLFPVPVQSGAHDRLHSGRMLAVEYVKLLAAYAGLSRLVRQPLSLVFNPVDNSVAG